MIMANNSEAATDKVTYEMLDAAAAEVEGEEEKKEEAIPAEPEVEEIKDPEPPEKEPAKEEPEDNSERSKLGRKVQKLFEKYDKTEETLSKLSNILEQLATKTTALPEQQEEDLDEDIPMTKKEIRVFLENERRKELEGQTQYQNAYLKTVSVLGKDYEKDEYEAIFDEMMSNFNEKHSSDASADAERNFYKAERAYLRKQLAQPKGKENPLKGEPPIAPLGVASSQKVTAKTTALPELDDAAKDFLNYVKRKDGAEAAEKLHQSVTTKPKKK